MTVKQRKKDNFTEKLRKVHQKVKSRTKRQQLPRSQGRREFMYNLFSAKLNKQQK